MTSHILIENLRLYAYHGVAPQEQLVGNEYTLNLRLRVDISRAAQTDDVADTINYADIVGSVRDEMTHSSRLLEHVALRIVRRLFNDFSTLTAVSLRLAKRNPPMGADVDAAGVELDMNREDTQL